MARDGTTGRHNKVAQIVVTRFGPVVAPLSVAMPPDAAGIAVTSGSVRSRKFRQSVERAPQALAAVERAHNYAHYRCFPLTVFHPVALRKIISPGPDSNSKLTFSRVFPMSLSDSIADPTP